MMKTGPKYYDCNVGDIVTLKKSRDLWVVKSYGACDYTGHRDVLIVHKNTGITVEINSKLLSNKRFSLGG